MSKNFECIDFRTARRLAAHGWAIYSRDTLCGIQWAPTASARFVRRAMNDFERETRDNVAYLGAKQPKVLTFRAVREPWPWN